MAMKENSTTLSLLNFMQIVEFIMNCPPKNALIKMGQWKGKTYLYREIGRVMIKGRKIPIKLWVQAVNTACYTLNGVYLRSITIKTPCPLWKGNKPNLKHLYEFGSTCNILNDIDQREKFDAKGDEGIFFSLLLIKSQSISSLSQKIYHHHGIS